MLERFAAVLFFFIPNFTMNTATVQEQIKLHGLDGFLHNSGNKATELVEIAELLARLEKGGTDSGSG